MSEIQNIAAGAAAAEAKLPRYTFTIPASARREGDPEKVTLRELTYAEEKAALMAKDRGGLGFEYEGAMRSMFAADGKRLTWENDGKQNAFESLSPKARDLVVGGFMRYCIPTKEERDDFFSSVVIEVGA